MACPTRCRQVKPLVVIEDLPLTLLLLGLDRRSPPESVYKKAYGQLVDHAEKAKAVTE